LGGGGGAKFYVGHYATIQIFVLVDKSYRYLIF